MWQPGEDGQTVYVKGGNVEAAIKKFIKKTREWKPTRPDYFQSKSEIKRRKKAASIRAHRLEQDEVKSTGLSARRSTK